MLTKAKKVSIVLVNLGYLLFAVSNDADFRSSTLSASTTRVLGSMGNHSYPRVGFLQWGGANPSWDAKFDLIITTKTDPSYAQFIKTRNPNAIVLYTKDINKGGIGGLPDEWWIRNSKGEKIKIYGGGWNWADYTDFCPRSPSFNNMRYNEYIGIAMGIREGFDGVATDGLWITGYCPVDDIDIDRNGRNDFDEHSSSWVREQLKTGAYHALESIRQRIGNKLLFVNSGGFHSEGWDITNGLWLEHFKGIYSSWQYFWSRYRDFMTQAKEPHIFLMDGYYSPKENFEMMRFTLGLTLLGDGYYGNDVVWNHYGVNWYDEFDTDLGYPTTDAQAIPGTEKDVGGETRAVYARFFDNGVTIVNPTGSDITITDGQLRQMSGYSGPYYRFSGGQNPAFNNGEQFSSVFLKGWTEASGRLIKGDGIILLKNKRIIVSDIYVDNVKVGTSPSSHRAKLRGEWKQETDKNYKDLGSWQIAFAPWKDIYPYATSLPGNGENTAIFRPTIGVAGNYEVFEWHGRYTGTQASNVPYEIHHRDGTKRGTIDQTQNHSKWNSLGIYYFDKGTSGYVKITNNANGVVIADVFKFVFSSKSGNTDTTPPNPPQGVKVKPK